MKMRNRKIAMQIQAKEKHKAERQAAKLRRRDQPILERAVPTMFEKPTILIVCEGKNTEPSYFKKFKLSSATIEAVGNSNNTTSLVNQALNLSTHQTYDQVWCVFDKDSFPANNFNSAISMAQANGFGVAYSNQAFEYWLILHFEDHQGGAMNRSEYEGTINKYIQPLGANYAGDTKIVSNKLFEILMGIDTQTQKPRIILAIERAKRIYDKLDHSSPAMEESSTKVFELVQEILKYV